MNYFKNFLLSLMVFLIIDFTWLGLIAKDFYNRQLAPFSFRFSLLPAVLAYFLLAGGITVFVLSQTSSKGPLAFLLGAGFGLVVYGVYDLTNLATLADWSLKMTVVDMLWGATVCSLTTLIVGLITK